MRRPAGTPGSFLRPAATNTAAAVMLAEEPGEVAAPLSAIGPVAVPDAEPEAPAAPAQRRPAPPACASSAGSTAR
jgi:hypothetical protein